MEVSNPRRILAVSPPDSGLIELIEALTGSPPTISTPTIAGTTHVWRLKTSYYTAIIPIWLDEITSPADWARDFLAPEAREVLLVLGAVVVCFRKPVDEAAFEEVKVLLESVARVVKEGCGGGGGIWDGVCLAVGMAQSITPSLDKSTEEWEEVCMDVGFEYVDFERRGRNEFAEPVGLERLKEALETNDWESIDDELDDVLGLDEFDDGDPDEGFGIEAAEMEMEMFGMKQAIHRDDGGEELGGDAPDREMEDDEEVEKLQAMMMKMQAVRDMGADMSEAERKRMAARTVNEIMKTL